MRSKCTRRLIWIPVIHTEADLGSLSARCEDFYKHKIGAGKWEQNRKTVEELWQAIRHEVSNLHLDYEKARLYQDSLPSCGYEELIVRDMAKAGSQNHLLLLELMEKGAKLTGTESPELLKQEYELVWETLESAHSDEKESVTDLRRERANDILQMRDRYIAQRINDTLANGETGLIFLGMLHSLEGLVAPDVPISILAGRKQGESNEPSLPKT